MNSMRIVTNHKGDTLSTNPEPERGSVVLTNGQTGTAWQRFMSDGKWHSTRGGRAKDWTEMLRYNNLIVIYEADARPEVKGSMTGRIAGGRPNAQEIDPPDDSPLAGIKTYVTDVTADW